MRFGNLDTEEVSKDVKVTEEGLKVNPIIFTLSWSFSSLIRMNGW